MQRLIISPLNSLDSFHIVISTLIFQLLNIVNSFRHTSQESDIWLFKCSNICKFDFNRKVFLSCHMFGRYQERSPQRFCQSYL